MLCFRGRLDTQMLVTTTTLASTPHQHFLNHATPSEIYPLSSSTSTHHCSIQSHHSSEPPPAFIRNRQGRTWQPQGGVWLERKEGNTADLAQLMAGEQLLYVSLGCCPVFPITISLIHLPLSPPCPFQGFHIKGLHLTPLLPAGREEGRE